MQIIIDKIVSIPFLHARWLNTLSMMENTGAKKIKNCEDPVFVNEIILKHSAEEARHAYYLKKQISKIEENGCPTYEKTYLLAPDTSYHYLNALDIKICRYLKSAFGYTGSRLKYAAYLLVTYAIEVRADELYPIYQNALTASNSSVTVKSIIAEEKNHLEEMVAQLKEFSSDWQELSNFAVKVEQALFQLWQADLENLLV
ncbi:MAG: hypothetical protein M3Q97_00450 [Bacteroidota bacterium]|nr:hypothetical protein [Bacteroidota bacterium]